jgi:excisionase family DNA binding protein
MPHGYHSYLVQRRKTGEMPRAQQQLFDVNEAGTFLNVSPWTVRQLLWHGKIPRVRIGRLLRIDRRDLETYIGQNKDRGPA